MSTPTTQSRDPLGVTHDAFVTQAVERSIPRNAASQAYATFFRTGACTPWLTPLAAPVVRTQRDDPTTKFVQRMADGRETEAVILPQRGRRTTRNTLCVSSQVGCAMGCTFCETAQMGFLRNLTAAEIVAQWRAARFDLGAPIDNVVFMGMGEPMDNLPSVLDAIRVLSDHRGPAIPASRITVSTVGRTAGIQALAAFMRDGGYGRLGLAVSVNAPNDTIRSSIMPLNRAEPMASLRAAMDAFVGAGRRRVLIEYVVIPEVNDETEHARELAAWLGDLPCTVNVIPYNPRRDSPWPAPTEATVDAFAKAIADTGVMVRRRRTLGRDVMAACGQLGNPKVRRARNPQNNQTRPTAQTNEH